MALLKYMSAEEKDALMNEVEAQTVPDHVESAEDMLFTVPDPEMDAIDAERLYPPGTKFPEPAKKSDETVELEVKDLKGMLDLAGIKVEELPVIEEESSPVRYGNAILGKIKPKAE